jgi:hypothetical protein
MYPLGTLIGKFGIATKCSWWSHTGYMLWLHPKCSLYVFGSYIARNLNHILQCSQDVFSSFQSPLPLVFVSPEDTVTVKFLNYIIQLHTLKLLARIVIDKAHLINLHSDFQYCLKSLKPLVTTSECGTFADDHHS